MPGNNPNVDPPLKKSPPTSDPPTRGDSKSSNSGWTPPAYGPLGGTSPDGGGTNDPGYRGGGTRAGVGDTTWLGQFDGTGNPNTGFNPNTGYFAQGNVNLTSGGGGPTTSTAATAPSNSEYQTWLWEQILNEVLGLSLPDRSEIGAYRWTGLEKNSSGDDGRFYIYGITWGSNHQDVLIYLATELQTLKGPWDVFLNSPYQNLYQTESGQLNGWTTALDPDSFAPPVAALAGVEGFFANAAAGLNVFSSALAGDQAQFTGQAAGVFAQLIWDLWNQTNSVSTQLGLPGTPNSYSEQLNDSMKAATTFLNSIWEAYVNWSHIMQHSPLGAILAALLAAGVVTGSPGNWNTSSSMNPRNTPFGDLTTDGGWLAVEIAAKKLWNSALTSALDGPARTALLSLTSAFSDTNKALQVVQSATNPQITAPQPNFNYPNSAIPNSAYGGADPNLANALGELGNADAGIAGWMNDFSSALPNMFSALGSEVGSGFNSMANGIGGLGSGLSNALGGADSSLGGAFSNVGSNLGSGTQDALLNGVPTGAQSSLGSGVQSGSGPLGGSGLSSDLGNALAGTGATESAIKSALALAPASGPLHNDLARALTESKQAQAALDSAELNGNPASLRRALADNGKTRSLLKKALALAPASGPLHNAIEKALAGSNRTETAIKHALASVSPAASSMHQALTSDHAMETALHKALTSAQAPKHGPLHQDLQTVRADNSKLQHALRQAQEGGVPTEAALHRAATDNHALQVALRKALGSPDLPPGALRTDLHSALTDSTKLGTELHQSLAQHGIVSEPGPGVTLGNGALTGPSAGGGPLVSAAGFGGGGGGVPGGVGGGAGGVPTGATGFGGSSGLGGAAGLAQAAPQPVSSGRFVAPAIDASSDSSAVPFFPPMAGGMGMGGAGGGMGGNQERERVTWLAEDEDVWGTDPGLGSQVLGRDFDDDDEGAEYRDDYTGSAPASRPARHQQRAR